ncbi:MAG: tetratricopeptide repeat protein, partial [Chitinispirillia bacterium]
KNYKEAVEYLEKVSDATLYDTKYYKALGHSYYYLNNYKKASEYYTTVWNRKVSNKVLLEILKPLGESLEKTGKNLDAANAYLAFTKLPGTKDADASYKKAFLREKEDPTAAQSMYTSNIQVFKNDYRNFYRLGILYARNKSSLKKSAEMLNTASMLNPEEKDILHHLGEVHGKLKNSKNQLITYQKLLKLDPQDETANRRVGMILLSNRKYSQAIINLEIVMTHTPNDVELILSLAEAYMQTERPQNAITLLNRAKDSKKHAVYVRDLLYKLYKQTNDKKNAEEEIIKLIELTKENKYKLLYIRDLIDIKKYDKANDLVMEIKSKDPSNVKCLMFLGEIQQAQNKLNEATETYKMISYIKDNYAPALCERGTIYLKQSKLERAKSFFNRCIKIDPDNLRSYVGLAQIAKAQNNNSLYSKYLSKVKSLDSNYSEKMGN